MPAERMLRGIHHLGLTVRDVEASSGAALRTLPCTSTSTPAPAAAGAATPARPESEVVVPIETPLKGQALVVRTEKRHAIDNDGNVAALGEKWLGAARDASSELFQCAIIGQGPPCQLYLVSPLGVSERRVQDGDRVAEARVALADPAVRAQVLHDLCAFVTGSGAAGR